MSVHLTEVNAPFYPVWVQKGERRGPNYKGYFLHRKMNFSNGTFSDVLNSSHGANYMAISATLGISHFILVVLPAFIISSAVLYYLYLLMKTSGIRPVLLLYFIIAVLCAIGPLFYSLVELTMVLTLRNNEGITCALATVHYVLVFGTGMIASYCTALVAVAQFLVLHSHQKQLITVSKVVISFVVMVLLVFAFNATLNVLDCFNYTGEYVTAAIWIFVAFIVPLVITVVFSTLTCRKVRCGVVEDTRTVVRSVVIINAINLLCYITFRLVGVVVYFTGATAVYDTESTLVLWKDISFVIADIGYPFTALSILVIHSKVRKMAFRCNSIERRDEELTNSSKVTVVSNV